MKGRATNYDRITEYTCGFDENSSGFQYRNDCKF